MKNRFQKNKLGKNIKNTIITTKYMLNYIWSIRHGRRYIFLKSFVALLTSTLPLALGIMPGLIINELTGEKRVSILLTYIGIIATIPFVQKVIISSLNVYLNRLRYFFMIEVKTNFIRHCADMDLETMENPDIQILKERAEGTTSDALNTFEKLSGLMSAVISLILCTSIIFMFNSLMLLVVIVVVIIDFFNNKWISQKNYTMNNEISKYNRYGWPIVNYFADLKYAKEMRLFNLKDYFIKLYKDKRNEANEIAVKNSVHQRNSSILGAIVVGAQTIALYSYIIYQVIFNNLGVGSMTIYLNAISQFSNSLTNISNQYISLSTLGFRVKELMEFMQIPIKNYNSGNKVPIFDKDSIIEFKNVSFKYPGSRKYALRNLNITIRGNEKLCIVGANGSGKTTFIKLLTRLYMPSEGEILLNGTNISDYDYLLYNKLFSAVFQDFSLFNISLGENIVMADKFDEQRLMYAINESGLNPVVNSNKKGYDTIIYKWYDQEAIEPSGGEGQRIAIARALYHGGNIYILDEPTAALDPMAEYEIYTQFNGMIENKCAILITHRLSAVQLVDKVAVFQDGNVVEYGTHKELYERSGLYTEMFDKQAQFYRDEKSSDN